MNKIVGVGLGIVVSIICLVLVLGGLETISEGTHRILEIDEVNPVFSEYDATFYASTGSTGTTNSIEFNDTDDFMAVGNSGGSKVEIFKHNPLSDEYEIVANALSPKINLNVFTVDFNNENLLAIGATNTPFLYIYEYDTFGNFVETADTVPSQDEDVLDLQFIDNDYLALTGKFSEGLKLLRYSIGDWSYEVFTDNTIGIGYDLDAKNDYLAVVNSVEYFTIYDISKRGANDITKLTLSASGLTGAGLSLDWNDEGDMVAVGGSGEAFVYKFENNDITAIPFNPAITDTSDFHATQFIDGTFLYFGTDNGVYKYHYDNVNNEFDLVTNDITTYTLPVLVIDADNHLEHLAVGDSTDISMYDTTYKFNNVSYTLDRLPTTIVSVKQLDFDIQYTITGKTITLINPLGDIPVYTDYKTQSEVLEGTAGFLDILPMLAVISIFVGVLAYVKFKN